MNENVMIKDLSTSKISLKDVKRRKASHPDDLRLFKTQSQYFALFRKITVSLIISTFNLC